MSNMITDNELAELPSGMREQFIPLDRRAAGLAGAATFAASVLFVTAFHLLFDPWLLENVEFIKDYSYSGDALWLLANYMPGYAPNAWGGALIGGLWAAWIGFVMGWTAAFGRNVFVAAWLVFVRSKARLRASREFLDQI